MKKTPKPLSARRLAILATCAGGAALCVAILVAVVLMQPGVPGPFIERVSAASEFRIRFPENMNKESVLAHLLVPPGLKGETHWDGDILVYKPTTPLEPDDRLSFTVDRDALGADGQPIGRDLVFTFVVSGTPSVSARMPAPGGVNIDPAVHVTIVFDRPIVALSQVDQPATPEGWKVTMEPETAGRWRWLGTHAAEFIPANGALLPSTLYTVTVPAGIKTANGETTDKDFTWKFETRRPVLTETEPADGADAAGPGTGIVLRFNQDIDLESLAKHVEVTRVNRGSGTTAVGLGLTDDAAAMNAPAMTSMSAAASSARILPSGEKVIIATVRYGTVPKDGRQVTDRRTAIVVPAKPLELRSIYTVRVTAGLHGLLGNLGSAHDAAVRFATAGKPRVLSAVYEYGSVRIDFSNPMKEAMLRDSVELAPPPANWKDTDLELSAWSEGRQLYFYPSLDASTAYTLTVKGALQDEFGQPMGEPFVYHFDTPELDPAVSVKSQGEFGIFERGKPPVYILNAVNVSRLELEVGKLDLPKFLETRRDQYRSGVPATNLQKAPQHHSWSIPLTGAKRNEFSAATVDLQKTLAGKPESGIYAINIRAPEYVNPNTKQPLTQTQYFALTNIALTLKHSGKKALVWAVHMQTGEPVAGAQIRFHSLTGTSPISGTTDNKGFFETELPLKDLALNRDDWRPEFWVTAEKDGDFAFVSSLWNEGMFPNDFGLWSDFQSPSAPQYRPSIYMYSDRPLYRPGDTAHFKGIVRLKDWDGRLHLPAKGRTARVTLQDPEGKNVYEKTLTFSDYGTLSGDFPVDANASLGLYYFNVQVLPDDDTNGYSSGSPAFSVLAYRKPEYRVDLTPKADDYYNRQTVGIDLAGSYYFGAPLANAPVTWNVELTDYYFNKYTDGWYSFALEDAWCWYDCAPETSQLTQGTGRLDAAGRMSIDFPVSIDDKSVSQIATISAGVTDPNNQAVSNRVSVPVHKAAAYVGIRTTDYVVAPGESVNVDLVTVKPDGTPLANQQVTLKLLSRTWNTVKKKGVDGEYYYDNEPKDTLIRELSATTGGNGKGTAALKVEKGGEHRIVATVTDGEGRTAQAATSAYVWSSTYVNWPHANNNRIEVLADKPEYKTGDTAKLLIKTPFQGKGVTALVTVERENVMKRQVVEIKSNAQPVEVEITEDLVPNAYVSVVIVKPRDGETFDENGLDTGAPAFRVGYVRLPVETSTKELTVSVSTDKQKYLPGEKVTATIRVRDAAAKAVQAEVSLGVVDLSVLALSGFERPDLIREFYSEHGLGVYTSQSLTYLIERFKPGSKGGGGGLDVKKRGNFLDTAYWNPAIMTDAPGNATVSFTLPDNLTTWQLLAIANTKDSRFGAGVKEITETKQVILRPVRPRFGVRGDEVTLGAIVHNYLDGSKTFTVSLSGTGFTALGEKTQKATITKDGSVKLNFPVRIGNPGKATFLFTAETPGARDQIEETIPVEEYGTPQSVATSGITDSLVTEHVLVPSVQDAKQGTLNVTVSPSLATYLPDGLGYLADFPYGCAEQTASAFLPALALSRLQGFDAFNIVSKSTLEQKLTDGLQTLYAFQRPDGGFGYWAESDRSYPYLTAYVYSALQLSKESDHAVDQGVMNRAAQYLTDTLRAQNLEEPLELATRAYILHVLAESGRGDENLAYNLYDRRENLTVAAKAELAMSLQKISTGGSRDRAKKIIKEILDGTIVDPRGAHFEDKRSSKYSILMQTPDRTSATVLRALLRIDPGHPLVSQVIRTLLASRKDGHWDTTQSTAATLIAFTDYLKLSKELDGNFTAGAEVNGAMKIVKKFDGSNIRTREDVSLALDTLLRGKENNVKIGLDGTGRLYYDLEMTYLSTKDELPPEEEGMGILREIAPVVSEPAGTPVRVGNTYKVTLTMTVPADRHFVAVESPLPGGMEAIDLGLKTSPDGEARRVVEQANGTMNPWMNWYVENGLWHFRHIEFRDDRVFLFADELPAGVYQYTYLVRATTPGKFRERPARIWEMYFPEVFGQTAGHWFSIAE